MAKEIYQWPVALIPWSDGETFTVRGLAPRASTKFNIGIDPPEEYLSDLTSSPPLTRAIVSIWGLHGLAALYHDYLYRHRIPGITRKMADQIMLEFMLEDGVAEWKAHLIYRTLRYSPKAKRAWRKNRAD